MTEQRFQCTACGRCCYGWVPLTLADAMAQAGLFPLAVTWTPVYANSKAHAVTARLGVTVQLPGRKNMAVMVAPTLYIPPDMPCPALQDGLLCGIQEQKPLRCRTMPFDPWREAEDQRDMLVPRKGWLCDTSADAPVVYRDRKILDRVDFDRERDELEKDGAMLRGYVTSALKTEPTTARLLAGAARGALPGRFALSLLSVLRRHASFDLVEFAQRQRPVLLTYADKTQGLAEHRDYHAFYRNAAEELRWFAEKAAR